MISLRVKLVAYFLVLSLLPLAAGYWSFASAAKANESGRVDEGLRTSLRASVAAFDEELAAAHASATSFARGTAFQRALIARDRDTIARLVRNRRVRVEVPGSPAIGRSLRGADTRVRVAASGQTLGWVVATVPFDRGLARRLLTRSGLDAAGRVALLDGSRVIGAPVTRAQLTRDKGVTSTLVVDGEPRRTLVTTGLGGRPELGLALLTPPTAVGATHLVAVGKLVAGVIASLLLIALVAYIEGVSITRTLRRFIDAANAIAIGRLGARVQVRSRDELGRLGRALNEMAGQLELERGRLRTIILRFGEALAATHDLDQLLRVTVETAVETTGATGGAIVRNSTELVRIGELDGTDRMDVDLEAGGERFGTLVLTSPAFSQSECDAARSLVAHASVALQNARLYEIVEHQALVDSLTGLANRRQCENALEDEIARALRSREPFAFVLADVDDFKSVNDTHGHLAGDRALHEFGALVRESVREIDLAARWGGEEFALILSRTDIAGAEQLVERIRMTLETTTIHLDDGTPVSLTASFGIAAYPDETSSAMLVRAADAALYEAKRTGKNRVATAAALVSAA